MFGTYKSGFTLLELLIAIALIAILATVVVPTMRLRRPHEPRLQFIQALNALTRMAKQFAIREQKTHAVLFNFTEKKMSLGVEKESSGQATTKEYLPVKGAYMKTSYAIPTTLSIKNFFIEGFDEMQKFVGGRATEIWYLIYPSRATQKVVINFTDNLDTLANARPKSFGLVLNPFTASFTIYDTFQKP